MALIVYGVDATVKNGTIDITGQEIGIYVTGGELTLEDVNITGKGTYEDNVVYGIYIDEGSLTMNGGSVAVSNTVSDQMAYGIVLFGNNSGAVSKITATKATIEVDGLAISGNGEWGNTEITLTDCTITSKEATAIYHPQVGTLTITGCTITGETGIEIRSGKLTISDSTVTGNGDPFTAEGNGDGTTTLGSAIAVVQHTTRNEISVTIGEGTILNGIRSLYQANLENSSDEEIAKVTMAVNGGTFNGEVYAENCTAFVNDGLFAKTIHWSYLVEGKALSVEQTNNYYTVVEGTYDLSVLDSENNELNRYSSLATAVANAADGNTIKLLANITVSKAITVDKDITIDFNGFKVTYNAPTSTDRARVRRANGSSAALFTVSAGKTLTLTNASIETDGTAVENNGTLNVNGGEISGAIVAGSAATATNIASGATITGDVTVDGGTLQIGGTVTGNVESKGTSQRLAAP